MLGEFGGLGMPVSGHTWQAEKNWGYVSFDTKEALTDAYVGYRGNGDLLFTMSQAQATDPQRRVDRGQGRIGKHGFQWK